MDNAMYDELSVMPISSDETYSRLRVINNKIKPNDEIQRRKDTDQSSTKRVKPTGTKETSNNTKFNIVLIITMAILLLLIITSLVISVVTFSQLTSEQSKLVRQLDNNKDTNFDKNFTQLVLIQNNISRTLSQLDDQISHFISAQMNNTRGYPQYECGPGLWWQVAYLDMTDPSQQCPLAWREYNTSGVKACGRPVSSTGSCVTEFYFTDRQYSRVCGRIIGYQVASPDAFANNFQGLDGVNISHGVQHEHIWSYVAGWTENRSQHRTSQCPCSEVAGDQPSEHIGGQYYCESGNPYSTFERGRLYFNDKLWDGQQCEGTCCTGTKSPPWFSVQLPAPTTDIIEVSVCCDQGTMDEDTPVELIEIFVQ